MEIMKENGNIKKWGNTKGIVLPKAVLKNADLKDKENVTIKVEIKEDGKKRIIIEDAGEDQLKILDELAGVIRLPDSFSVREERNSRKQERLVKHEVHH
ncbi:MAG TPA: hypothetical protein VK118_07060 [Tetragenococcus sp.]|nr:hypothetical protein [Tetragenococcus sp.]